MLGAIGRLARQDKMRRGYLIRAVWHLALGRARHRLLPTARVLTGPQVGPERVSTINPDHVARAIETAARRVPWRADCLVQAIAGAAWLRRAGYDATIHLGVAPASEAGLAAHAWLELDGRVILGDAEDGTGRFTPIFPPRAPLPGQAAP